MIKSIHPGEHLVEFLEDFDITPYRLAKDIDVPSTRIHDILKHNRSITADTATRFGKYFGTTAQFWMNLQSNYELELVDSSIAKTINQIAA